MKKSVKALLLVIIAAAVFAGVYLAPGGAAVSAYTRADDTYEITTFSADIRAEADRHVYVEETIVIYFRPQSYIPRYAYIRDLPVNDGLKIKDIKSDRNIRVEKNGDFLSVDLDSDNTTNRKNGQTVTYKLSYTMITPEIADSPEAITLNAVGQGFDSVIKSAAINLTLPKGPTHEIYHVGPRGAVGGANRLSVVQGADGDRYKVSISVIGELSAYEGVTVGYMMPDGTMHTPFDYSVLIYAGIAAALIAVVLFIRFTAGKKQEIFPVVNFNAPNGLNPAEAGLLIDGICSPSDLTSLIYYWAAGGYIAIEIEGRRTVLHKMRNLDTVKAHERTIFEGLFKGRDSVDVDDLREQFYPYIESGGSQIRSQYSGKIYDHKATVKAALAVLPAALFPFLAVLFSGFAIHKSYINPMGIIAAIVPAALFALSFMFFMTEPKHYGGSGLKAGFAAITAVGLLITYFSLTFIAGGTAMLGISAAALTLVSVYAAKSMLRRKEWYVNVLNDLIGFKNFITHAEKDRLEMLLAENPQYYYDVLPYANVLGVSEIWQDKFKGLTVEPPRYLTGSRIIDFIIINRLLRSSFSVLSTTLVSRPASSGKSGGGFGGRGGFGGGFGGFSGGGFGGGGGRAR